MRIVCTFILLLAGTWLTAFLPSCSSDSSWGRIAAGKDAENRWEASLENQQIQVRYGFKLSGKSEEGMITHFIHKNFPDENAAGHLLDAAAHRGLITEAKILTDRSEIKTLQVTWQPTPAMKDRHPGPAVSEVSIFPNSRFLRIDYKSYCFPHVCDIGAPGGLDCPTTNDSCGGQYVFYGQEAWQKIRLSISADSLRNHPNPHHRVSDDLFPLYPNPVIDQGWSDQNPMSYRGWYIMGVYSKENKRGFGRVFPVDAVPYLKLLWNKGFELFPRWRSAPRPHREYLFFVLNGEQDILSLGKELADGESGKNP